MPQVITEPIRLGQTFFTGKPYVSELIIPQKNE